MFYRIVDVNDNTPKFEDADITLYISEASPVLSAWWLPLAYDMDSAPYDVSAYTLYDPSLNFDLDVRYDDEVITQVQLILMMEMDRELREYYELLYVSSDRSDDGTSHSATMTVIINVLDSNDNTPTYDVREIRVNLPENTPIGDIVAEVLARDPDTGPNGNIIYTMTRLRDDADGIFHLDNTTGVISLQQPLDYESRDSYRLTITARDQGDIPRQSHVIVNVNVEDVNDNAPVLIVVPSSSDEVDVLEHGEVGRVAWVEENAEVGKDVALLTVEDPDSGLAGQVSNRYKILLIMTQH